MAHRKTHSRSRDADAEHGHSRGEDASSTSATDQHAEEQASATETDETSSSAVTEGNGAGAAHGESDEAEHNPMERAEEMVDRIAEKVAHYTSVFGRQLLRFGARAREEAEDMWAEAQSIRRGPR